MKTIGIVCEGPTDFIVITRIIDMLTGGENRYYKLQPEETLGGKNGNGWKGVMKWCRDNWDERENLMHQVQPEIDFLVIHMDGDVSRKEKPPTADVHPLPIATVRVQQLIHWIAIKRQKVVPPVLFSYHVWIMASPSKGT